MNPTAAQMHTLYDQIITCHSCGLRDHAWLSAMDRNLVWYLGEGVQIPLVGIGMAPAYCEDRTGIPFAGATELLEWRCGQCTGLVKCFGYFLHKTDDCESQPCLVGRNDMPPQIKDGVFDRRLTGVAYDMRFVSSGDFSPRTAGEVLNHVFEQSGIVRASHADYLQDQHAAGMTVELHKPNIGMINTVQCRAQTCSEDKSDNRPPTKDERDACQKHVESFIDILKPKAILCFGIDAIKSIIDESHEKVGALIGKEFLYKDTIPAYAFYHPYYYLHHLAKATDAAARVVVLDALNADIIRLQKLRERYC